MTVDRSILPNRLCSLRAMPMPADLKQFGEAGKKRNIPPEN
jgi:hypothetical protein